MKKIVRFLVLCLLFMPALVYADMGAPEIRRYEAIVINPYGIDYRDYYGNKAGHFDKDQVLTVVMELDDDELIVRTGEDEPTYYIKNNGLVAKTAFVNPTDSGVYKVVKERKAIVNNKNGVSIRRGPSKVYDVVGTIPYGVELKWQYCSGSGGGFTHIYTEYKGISGWVEILKEDVFVDSNQYLLFSKEYQLSCGKIPPNTILKSSYESDAWSRKYMISYNDCSTIVSAWNNDGISSIWSQELEKIKLKKDTPIYQYVDLSGDPIGNVSAGESVVLIAQDGDSREGHYKLYIAKDDIVGWVQMYDNGDGYERLNEKVPLARYLKEEVREELVPEEPKEEVTEEKENKSSLSVRDIVIICMVAGFSLAIGGVGTLILINKKKDKKKAEHKPDLLEPQNNKEEKIDIKVE